MSDARWDPPEPGTAAPLPPPAGGAATTGDVAVSSIERSPRSRWPLVGLVVGILAIGATGMFAVAQFSDETRGAASPEELGRRVLAAIDDGDVLGLFDLLAPDEREVVRAPFLEFVGHLGRLDVVGAEVDLAGVQGLEVTIESSEVVVQPTSVPDIANVSLSGLATVTVDGERLPIGDLWLDRADEVESGLGLDRSDLDSRTTESFDIDLTAVEVGGDWYLSVFFSLAEAARQSLDPIPDIPDVGVEPVGGSTPEAALDTLLAAVEGLDLARVIAALNPGEAAALQRYAPLFLADAQDELDSVPLDWRILEAEYTVTGSGDVRQASIDVLVIEGDLDGASLSLEVADGCVRVRAEGEEIDSCAAGGDAGLEDLVGDSEAVARLVDELSVAFADYEQPGIVLRRTAGSWYVSPLSTVAEQMLAVLRALDRSELDAIIDALWGVAGELFGGVWSDDDWPGWTDDDWTDDTWTDDTWTDDTWTDDTWTDGWTDDRTDDGRTDDETGAEPIDRCYLLDEVAAATACFEELIGADEIADWQMPTELRFPECGVSAAYWQGYGSLSDEEFLETVRAASPCFLALLEQGVLDEFDLSYEYTHLECFENRNWYGVFDDPDYDERFDACIAE